MSTVNQDELKAIKVLKFTGKASEWYHWCEKFVALARARGFAGILLGTEQAVEKSVFSIWVDLLLCRSIQLLVLSYVEMFVYMYLSKLMSTFTNYLKVHHLLDGFFIP